MSREHPSKAERLEGILHDGGGVDTKLLSLSVNAFASSHDCDTMRYRLGNGEVRSALVKSTTEIEDYTPAHGGGALSRGLGLVHEIETYRRILSHAPVETASLLGSWIDRSEPSAGLVLEYLEGACQLSKAVQFERAMEAAAEWLGKFHKFGERRSRLDSHSFLRRFGAGSLRARRDAMLQCNRASIESRSSSILAFTDTIESSLDELLASVPTIIHGEFYPENVLVRDGEIVPVDWETTLVGPGEIDLAMLLEGWDSTVRERCHESYSRARFQKAPDGPLRRRLAGADAFLQIYWLGYPLPATLARRIERLELAIEEIKNLEGSLSG